MLTNGNGVSNVNINELIKHHNNSKKYITLTAVLPSGKFGALEINRDNTITSFIEKPKESWVNGGFFVCNPEIFNYIEENNSLISFEREPLENLAKDKQLNAYKHTGFWQPMDTLRDKIYLNDLKKKGQAPWKVW